MGTGTRKSFKDSVFHMLFGTEENKQNALELYNAINDSSYSNPDVLTITTIDDVIYMSIKNDASFIIDDEMDVWEHQSTINPNMPLRGLWYFAKLYTKYAEENQLNVYGKTALKIPRPKYYVFYNGDEEAEEVSELKLSDMYEGAGDIEVKATMLNINKGKNQSIQKACKALHDYSYLVAKVKENSKTMELSKAIDLAVKECIANDVMKDFLSRHRAEVIDVFMTEYDEVKTMNLFKQEGRAEGRAEGREEGLRSAYETLTDSLIAQRGVSREDAEAEARELLKIK